MSYFWSYDKAADIIRNTMVKESLKVHQHEISPDDFVDNVPDLLNSKLEGTMMPTASGVGSFVAASYAIPLMTNTLCTHESVKKAMQIIPHLAHPFLVEHGNRILASAVGYTTRIAVDEGSEGFNRKNAISFCERAVVDMRCVFTKQYFLDPISNCLLGERGGLHKTSLNFSIKMGVNMYFLNPVANCLLGKEEGIRRECLKLAISVGAIAALDQAMQKIT